MQAFEHTRRVSRRPYMEHRYGQRVAIAKAVRIRGPLGQMWTGTLRDASISGGYVECADALPFTQVEIVVPSARANGDLVLRATVVRLDETGFGVEWNDMAAPDVLELLRSATHGANLAIRDPGLG